jgi:hypothetical protein
MKIAGKMIEAVIAISIVSALVPIAINGILSANLTGTYKTIYSIGAIVVACGVAYAFYEMFFAGGGRKR